MVIAKTMIKNQLMTGMSIEKAMTVLNSRLYESTSNNMSVSVIAGVLEIGSGLFSYVNAGGNVPALRKRGGNYEFISEQIASVLAKNNNVVYRKLEVELRQGDRLVLYNDGAINIKSAADDVFGDDRLLNTLNSPRIRDSAPEDTLSKAIGDIKVFADAEERTKDIGMLVLDYSKGDRTQADISIPPREANFPKVLAFIKKQLAENGLGGAFYAVTAVTVEELLLLLSKQPADAGAINVRCGVYGPRVEIKMLYGGMPRNILESADGKEKDAIGFIRSRASELYHDIQDGRNVLTMVHIIQ
jgi:hypothetical protein